MQKSENNYDVAIIGGGINGCAIASALAQHGLSVYLCDKNQIASGTSSRSSSLIHGGIRYLENLDFGLVKKSIHARQELFTKIAPHLVKPIKFTIPHVANSTRPSCLIRLGLFIYDFLNIKNTLPKSKSVKRNTDQKLFLPLNNKIKNGVAYFDAQTDDARLTLTKAKQAKLNGAIIEPFTNMLSAEKVDNYWRLNLSSKDSDNYKIKAKVIINAAGPWVNEVANILNNPINHKICLVKGSHIMVPKQYIGEHAYLLQNKDGRIVFVIPFHNHTYIGTTDVPYFSSPDIVEICDVEIDYLLNSFNNFFETKITASSIISKTSGLRVLSSSIKKSAKDLSRNPILEYSKNNILNVIGGKLTTHNSLAKEVLKILKPTFPNLNYKKHVDFPLPGATLNTSFGIISYNEYCKYAYKKYSWINRNMLSRYLNNYGTLTEDILKNCNMISDLGQCFKENIIYQVEIDYLIKEEGASSLREILWLHSKLGLIVTNKEIDHLNKYINNYFLGSSLR